MSLFQAKETIGSVDPNLPPTPASHPHLINIKSLTDAPLWVYKQKRKEEYGWNTIRCQRRNDIIVGCVCFITNTIHNNTTCNIRSRWYGIECNAHHHANNVCDMYIISTLYTNTHTTKIFRKLQEVMKREERRSNDNACILALQWMIWGKEKGKKESFSYMSDAPWQSM